MTLVVGLDLSLASTGIAHATPDGIVTDTLRGRGDGVLRLRRLRRAIRDHARTADLVVLEAPAYSHGTDPGFHERAGLHWMVLEALLLEERPVVQVPPSSLKKYATGNGNAKKTAVVDAAARRYPRVETGGDDNQADALWLAAMGIDHLTGQHVVPEAHRATLAKVNWPELAMSA